MRTLYSLLACTSLMSLTGCLNSNSVPQPARALNLDSIPTLPKVDPKTLLISDIQVVQFANPEFEGALQPLVDFRYSGTAEYVEIVTCVEPGESCSEAKDIFKTKSILANAPSGARVVVKLRACVSPGRSLGGSNCGEWFTSEYTQWAVTDQAKAKLQAEQEAIEIAEKELRDQLAKVLKMRTERANKCKAASPEQEAILSADKAMAESIGRLGQSALGVLSNALVRPDSSSCPQAAPPEQKEPPAEQQQASQNSTPAAGNLQLLGSIGGGLIGPNILSPDNIKKVVDTLSDALNKRRSASPAPSADGGAGAAAQCLVSATAPKAGRLTLDDVGAALPGIASAIFDLSSADRRVKLEGICIGSLGNTFEQALAATEAAAKNTAARLQARQARLKSQQKSGVNP